jgi:hypothetical protein
MEVGMYQHGAIRGLSRARAVHSVGIVTRPRLFAATIVAAVIALAAPAQALASVPFAGGRPGKKPPPPASAGYDVSYPQCSSTLPSSPVFGIVGVTGGKPYASNSCLATQYRWAQTSTTTTYPKVSFYANTANPGPVLSTHWPTGATTPRACDGTWSVGCSYDYGWNAAVDSYTKAAVVAGAASAQAAYWWLDVETGNSWAGTSDMSNWAVLNTADLQGAAAYLVSQGVGQVGFYSTGYQWGQITGLNAATSPAYFAGTLANWVPGATTLSGAQARCSSAYSFTGARVQLTQYLQNGFDADYRCP